MMKYAWYQKLDEWLCSGGLVVTASERATRAFAASYHKLRRSEGLTAWKQPEIYDWNSFIRREWDSRNNTAQLVLNSAQEKAAWAEIIAKDQQAATLLEGPCYRLATLAMEAHELLCNYAPQYLRENARNIWQNDAGAFSEWLTAFDKTCRTNALISSARLPQELISYLEKDNAIRPPLLLAGFDRILPVQRKLFSTWGDWSEITPDERADIIHFYQAPDQQTELNACAQWCAEKLSSNSDSLLLIIAQDAAKQRGEIERALNRHIQTDSTTPLYEFSLGIPLSQIAILKAALVLLRWLSTPLYEYELDWLFFTGYISSASETSLLQARMRTFRSRGQERLQWSIESFLNNGDFSPTWTGRIQAAQLQLFKYTRSIRTPLEWSEIVPLLLKSAGFAATFSLSSAEFQAMTRWQQTLDTCASLGFSGQKISWTIFFSTLKRTLEETLFAPETRDASIKISGPTESSGLLADGIWFLGADENSWPANASMHPLLPSDLQLQTSMPHATSQLDWELATSITNRISCSATEVHFSFSHHLDRVEVRPSQILVQQLGSPETLSLATSSVTTDDTVIIADTAIIPFIASNIKGGSSVLTHQSQCPFKAFSIARLNANGWQAAKAGLSAAARGKLLHAVMRSIWSGSPNGIRSQQELSAITDLRLYVAQHVQQTFAYLLPPSVCVTMPKRYLELEERRLTDLITAWLRYEMTRLPFEVAEIEAPRSITIAGLSMNLRLDRIDLLSDDSLFVIDYKTGDVSPSVWERPRPEDVQLPLYATFALQTKDDTIGGLAFAKLRADGVAFAGCLASPESTLFQNLHKSNSLLKQKLTPEKLKAWREEIESLAHDFVSGHSAVDPKFPSKTCLRCELHTLCRIRECETFTESDEAEEVIDE